MIKIGIVGAGIIGETHKEAILKNNECEITAVCDLSIEKAETLAEGTKARVYTDYMKMQENESLDAVILNLPHFLHKDVSIYFLERGVATLVEKPMAITVEECDAMIEMANKTKTQFAVGHVQRYFEPYEKVKEIIQTNEIGKLSQIIEIRDVDYVTAIRPKWFLDKKLAGGGIIMNYGAHTLDKLSYVTGLEFENVYASGNNVVSDDNIDVAAQMLVKMKGGVSAICSYCGTHIVGNYETYFYFEKGIVKIVGGAIMEISKNKEPFKVVETKSKTLVDILGEQLAEFIKLLKGEESRIATPQFSREIIRTLESAVNQIH